jgi:hypothetical protein
VKGVAGKYRGHHGESLVGNLVRSAEVSSPPRVFVAIEGSEITVDGSGL